MKRNKKFLKRKEIDSCKHSKVNKILKSEYKKEIEDTLTKEE